MRALVSAGVAMWGIVAHDALIVAFAAYLMAAHVSIKVGEIARRLP